jgi:dihydroorotase
MKNEGSLLIQNGRVVDPAQNLDEVASVLIRKGKVARIARGTDPPLQAPKGIRTLDARGKVVCPGFIDMHVHLREPGFEHKEDIESGTKAAAHGGFSSVACMPNTMPVTDNSGTVDLIEHRARQVGLVNVFPVGAASLGMKGEELANIGELVEAGAVAVSDDGFPVQNNYVMRRILEYTGMFGISLISHPEDTDLSAEGVMHEGYYSNLLGLKGIPAASEEIAISRNIILGEMTGTPIHIAHVSTAGGVSMIREAKQRGVRITAEATPHHFSLADASLVSYDTNLKMKPPLRSEADVEALRQGLQDGTIDAIASDHAPHSENEKQVEFDKAPFGVIGLETTIPVTLDKLLHTGVLSLTQIVEKLSVNPARILKLQNKGTLKEGADGDVTILDLEKEIEIDPQTFASKSRNTPFAAWKLKGVPTATIVSGRIAFPAPSQA